MAPLWPMHGANLGTLLRTCDAVGACLAVPRLPWVPEALARGNTLRRPACVHWTGRDACQLAAGPAIGRIAESGVELAEEAIRLGDLPAARQRTIAVLGHEQTGIPAEAVGPARRSGGDPDGGFGSQPERGRGGIARAVPAGRAHLTGSI